MTASCEMSPATVVVRAARGGDLPARAQLLADAHRDSLTDAFFYFFFQELTLQAVVLAGAVLFIFCGVSATWCALVVPAAAAVVLLAVRMQHAVWAQGLPAVLRQESAGWVAEYRGPLLADDGAARAVRVLREGAEDEPAGAAHRRVLGTVSVGGHRGELGAGWLAALGVARGWRRRGLASALLATARTHAAAEGLLALHAVTSQLQPAARCLLHQHGWECRSTYHRPLLGEALTLPMAHLVLDLPHA